MAVEKGYNVFEAAELLGVVPMLALLWRWRPPAPFERGSV